jgi:hypothetical protein
MRVESRRTCLLPCAAAESRAVRGGGGGGATPGRTPPGSARRAVAAPLPAPAPVPCIPAFDSPKTTRPLLGRFFSAVAQSVAAGCLSAGTPVTQMRHIPGGGICDAGIAPFVSLPCATTPAGTTAAVSSIARRAEVAERDIGVTAETTGARQLKLRIIGRGRGQSNLAFRTPPRARGSHPPFHSGRRRHPRAWTAIRPRRRPASLNPREAATADA